MAVFLSVKELLSGAESAGLELWEYVLRASADETGISTEHSWAQMAARLEAMKKADSSYDAGMRSHSGLTGGDGAKMDAYAANGGGICGEFIDGILAAALRMGECNACMHCIVAAPTAGACGVLPAVLLPYGRRYELPDDTLIKALYVASGFGAVIAQRASISGAEAGCQAEIGSACSMAAAALGELYGMSIEQIEYAAEMAIEHHLGLTCDPVGGLVQIPCIERNAVAAMRAINLVSLASFLFTTRRVFFDTVVKTMYETGKDMSCRYRETAEGGLAKSIKIDKMK